MVSSANLVVGQYSNEWKSYSHCTNEEKIKNFFHISEINKLRSTMSVNSNLFSFSTYINNSCNARVINSYISTVTKSAGEEKTYAQNERNYSKFAICCMFLNTI